MVVERQRQDGSHNPHPIGPAAACPGGKYVITCNGRYLDGEPSWVTSRACAKRFGSIVDACEFFNQMAHYNMDNDRGAKLVEVAA